MQKHCPMSSGGRVDRGDGGTGIRGAGSGVEGAGSGGRGGRGAGVEGTGSRE